MNKPTAPAHKPPTYRLPEVPDYRPSRFPKAVYLIVYIGSLCVFLSLLLLLGWNAFSSSSRFISSVLHKPAPTARPIKPTPTPTVAPIQLSDSQKKILQNSCPDAQLLAPPSSQTTTPTLDFCSPKYYSNVTGPVGTHFTLIAMHISQQPQQWALVRDDAKSTLNDLKSLQTCMSTHKTECFPLPTPQTVDQLPAFSLYSWTWRLPTFPTDTTNYDIVAFSAASTPLLWSSTSFTLATPLPPCITIENSSNQSSGNCTAKRSLTLIPGDTITISGSNWTLSTVSGSQPVPVHVQVAITCQQKATCDPKTLPPLPPALVQADGSFTLAPYTLPAAITGTYTVTATVQVTQTATPGLAPNDVNNKNTIVANTLTFGEAGDATSLTVLIPVSPA